MILDNDLLLLLLLTPNIISLSPIGHTEGDTRPGRTRKKPKDLSPCESDDRGCGVGGGVFATLMQSDAVEPSGLAQ